MRLAALKRKALRVSTALGIPLGEAAIVAALYTLVGEAPHAKPDPDGEDPDGD